MEKIRIILFDNHPTRTQSIKHALLHADLFKIIGIFQTAKNIIEECERLCPDVILIGIRPPEDDPVLIAQQMISHFGRGVKIVLLSFEQNPYQIQQALIVGARAFFSDKNFIDLPTKLRLIFQNNQLLDANSRRLFSRFIAYTYTLSAAQMRVLGGIVAQKSRPEMERMYQMKAETLRQHIYRISLALKVKEGEKGILEHFNNSLEPNEW